MKGTTYFRYFHAAPQQAVSLDDDTATEQDVQRSLDALRPLVNCDCCIPAFRGERDGTVIRLNATDRKGDEFF